MQSIVGINFTFPSDDEDYLRLDGFGSLSDVDLAVTLLSFNDCHYKDDPLISTHQGKRLLSQESSTKLTEHIVHWQRELKNFLQNGKTLILFLKQKEILYIHTGKKEISGTGRNQKVSNIVEYVDNYKFLPFNISVYPSEGRIISPTTELVNNFYSENKDFLRYEAYVTGIDLNPLFLSKNKDKILGCHLKVINGDVIILPILEIAYENFAKQNGDWNVKGLKYGESLKTLLQDLNNNIKSKINKTPPPVWTESNEFEIKEAEDIKKKIIHLDNEIQSANKEKEELEMLIPEAQILKDLLYESGKALELAVIKALELLGYSAENFNDGKLELDQIIISPEGYRYIGECEGKDHKGIDVSKFRQLTDNLTEDFEREDVKEKAFGLLFGNPQRLIEPNKRTLDFTQKCVNGAKRDNIGLLRTPDLFIVARYLLENSDEIFKKDCRKAIHNQLGGKINFPALPKS